MSDTPRTDAEVAKINYDSRVMDGYDFARQLERELALSVAAMQKDREIHGIDCAASEALKQLGL